MAEPDHVSPDQHRADLAELRLELSGTLASLDKRTELILQELVTLRRETIEWRDGLRNDLSRETTDRRGDMSNLRGDMSNLRGDMSNLRGEMATLRGEMRSETGELKQAMRSELSDIRQEMRSELGDIRQAMRDLRGEMGAFRITTQRQLWTMIGVISASIITGLIKLVFFS